MDIYGDANGRLYFELRDDSSGTHYAGTAIDTVNYSEWFGLRAVWDFADLTRSEIYINDVADSPTATNMTGAVEFVTTDTEIRVGQSRASVVNSFCKIRNPRIWNSEVRP